MWDLPMFIEQDAFIDLILIMEAQPSHILKRDTVTFRV